MAVDNSRFLGRVPAGFYLIYQILACFFELRVKFNGALKLLYGLRPFAKLKIGGGKIDAVLRIIWTLFYKFNPNVPRARKIAHSDIRV